MSRISVRGFAVASATAVTTVGAVVGVATGDAQNDLETTASGATLLADIPVGEQAQVQTAALAQQADAIALSADADARKATEEAARVQAAQLAKEKKAAAEKAEAEAKAKKEREAKEQVASRSNPTTRDSSGFQVKGSYTVSEVKAIARQMVPASQFTCFSNIVNHESTWNYRAQNPSSGAYGLVQALPGSKMSSAGADWRTNPATQIEWGLNYMNDRYGSPCGAWSFWQANHWY